MPSINFNTVDRIIRTALDSAGLLADGETPNGDQYARCLDRLNDLVNLWQTQGLKLWLNQQYSQVLVAGTATYTPAARKMRVLEGYYVDANDLWRPLDALSWQQYNALSNKLQEGAVISYFANKGETNTTITLWNVPDTAAALGTCEFLVQVPVGNAINLADRPNFPNEWFMALHWGLADEICTGQPPQITERCAQRAAMYREALEGWDVEDAMTSWAPNFGGGAVSAFRR